MNYENIVLDNSQNSIIVLGATASGKTSYAVKLAQIYGAEIISVDSRQVYIGLDLGTGKDLFEYGDIPYHLIDVCNIQDEYNVFNFQRDAYRIFEQLILKNKLPIFAGGTGLYLDAIVRKYNLIPVPENQKLREFLDDKSIEYLQNYLLKLKQEVHNKTDLLQRERLIRAIEIAEYFRDNKEAVEEFENKRPNINPYIIGLKYERSVLHKRIMKRLLSRIEDGMIEETALLHKNGISWERLESLGLEYKFTAMFLQNKIDTKDAYIKMLYSAICKFAKRQETWFRRMEKNGVKINWLNLKDE